MVNNVLNTTNLFYTRDHLGSVREVVSNSGTTLARYDYSPYGIRNRTAGTFEAEKGYTGHDYHVGSGLVLTLYRAYEPQTGRWLSADPIGEMGELNLYGYAGNDPISRFDPLGLTPAGGGIGAGIGSIVGGIVGGVVGGSVGVVGGGVGGTAVCPGVGTAGGAVAGGVTLGEAGIVVEGAVGGGLGAWLGDTISDWWGSDSELPEGYRPADRGAEEWGRKNGVGAKEGRARFHDIKGDDPASRPRDKYGVNPNTGDVCDPDGENVGNLGK